MSKPPSSSKPWACGNKKGSCPLSEEGKGGRATRPPLQQHRMNEGDSPSFAATQDGCGRLALLYSNTGWLWASRPLLQPHRMAVGESPTLLSRPMAHSVGARYFYAATVCRFNRDCPTNRRRTNKKGGHCCPPQSESRVPLESVADRESHCLAVEIVVAMHSRKVLHHRRTAKRC